MDENQTPTTVEELTAAFPKLVAEIRKKDADSISAAKTEAVTSRERPNYRLGQDPFR